MRVCFAYKSVVCVCVVSACGMSVSFPSQDFALWYDIFRKVRSWTSLSSLPQCMFVYVWVCSHVYAHPCFPTVHIKSITRCVWHSSIWPPGGVVAWQSAAVDISHMELLRFTCCSLDSWIYDPKQSAIQRGRGPSKRHAQHEVRKSRNGSVPCKNFTPKCVTKMYVCLMLRDFHASQTYFILNYLMISDSFIFLNILNPQSNNWRVFSSDATFSVENSHPLASLVRFYPGRDRREGCLCLRLWQFIWSSALWNKFWKTFISQYKSNLLKQEVKCNVLTLQQTHTVSLFQIETFIRRIARYEGIWYILPSGWSMLTLVLFQLLL